MRDAASCGCRKLDSASDQPFSRPESLSANGVLASAARDAKDSMNKIDTKLEGGDFKELLATIA
jgi:hypothetical protein